MDKTENEYAAFERAMDEDRIYRRVHDFWGICLRIGVDPFSLDRMIRGELGFRGQELVDSYRRIENIH